MMKIGFVGCGFTADSYMLGIKGYPSLELVAATDRDMDRARGFCNYHSVPFCPDLETMLSDNKVEAVVNLTNSSNHFEVSKACLEAGKHVYTEKPLALTLAEARELVELSKAKGVYLAGAPSTLLGNTGQTLGKALGNQAIGKVRLAYAELDDGPFHLGAPHTWSSGSGAPFDYRAEFEAGVTVEHASYFLSLFAAFFGPAKTITSFSTVVWPDRLLSPDMRLQLEAPDFSVACITFASGVVARLTCSLVAPYNHMMRIVGDTGVLRVDECWNFDSPVFLDQYSDLRYRAERYPITKSFPTIARLLGPRPRVYPAVRKASLRKRYARYNMDYLSGVADLAEAIAERRPPVLSEDFCLHVTELLMAIQRSDPTPYEVTTTFQPRQFVMQS